MHTVHTCDWVVSSLVARCIVLGSNPGLGIYFCSGSHLAVGTSIINHTVLIVQTDRKAERQTDLKQSDCLAYLYIACPLPQNPKVQ